MSAGRDRRGAARLDLDGTVLVSRQPVFDRKMRVAGYRIAYALPGGNGVSSADSSSLFDTALSVIGLEKLVGGSIAHLPITRELLLALGEPPGRSDRLMLRIAHQDAVDPVLTPILQLAAERGYALELDQLAGHDFDPELLDLFSVVEIDLEAVNADEVATLVPELLSCHRTPLAANLRDHDERDRAHQLGFELFTGPFYGTAKLVQGHKVPTGDLRMVASMVRLQPDSISLEQVVEVIEQDLGLSVKLLRYLNSAYFGLAAKVSSIHDAAMRLGSRGVARWALTVAVAGAPRISPELAVMALTRARLCELLGAGEAELEPGEMFMIGLLSAADAVFGRPLERIIPELPLTDRATAALLAHSGPAGDVVRAAIAYECGNFGDPVLARLATGHGRSYRSALGWAQDTLP